jgi:hypothetical protein
MLQVQEYLRNGKTLEDLTSELAIRVAPHPELPLVILNYDQIESQKSHPIVRECRGLVLETGTFNVVARAMNRFFNWGEMLDEAPLFDFTDFHVQEKLDGSLCLIYNYGGRWMGNTRGSFASGMMESGTLTWQEGFCRALKLNDLQDLDGVLDPELTYVCEFVSPWNKVVRRYEEPALVLLTAFRGHEELNLNDVYKLEKVFGCMTKPDLFEFKSIEEIQRFLDAQAKDDPTFEGVVIRDRNNRRWKIKNSTYLALHRLKGEAGNLFHPRHLLPFILAGEESELLTYFPEVSETFYEYKGKVDAAFNTLREIWEQSYKIEGQKDFALAIASKTPFTGILFQIRKKLGADQTLDALKQMWRDSPDAILKFVFDK